jgi:hypothetical protein
MAEGKETVVVKKHVVKADRKEGDAEEDAEEEDENYNVDSLFWCAVCRERVCAPITLPCQHTFCQECVEGLPGGILADNHNNQNNNQPQQIVPTEGKCPLCRHSFAFPPLTASNHTIKDAMNLILQSSSGSNNIHSRAIAWEVKKLKALASLQDARRRQPLFHRPIHLQVAGVHRPLGIHAHGPPSADISIPQENIDQAIRQVRIQNTLIVFILLMLTIIAIELTLWPAQQQ